MIRTLTLFCFAVIGFAVEPGRRLNQEADLRFAWPRSERESLERGPKKEDLELFFRSLYRRDGVQSVIVQQFRFVPLRRGAAPGLVAVLGEGGRPLFWSLTVVEPAGELFNLTDLHSAAPHNLDEEVVDLDGDGLIEILTRMPVGGYQGARTRPIFVYSIYKAADDGSLVDAGSEFKSYYEKVIIPELQPAFERLKTRFETGLAYEDPRAPEETKKVQQMSKEDLAAAATEVQFVLDHYQRAIYGRKNAGLETALAWSQPTESSHTQLLAAKALEEMDHPAAILALDRLAKTGNRVVSGQAKGALVRMKILPPQVVK